MLHALLAGALMLAPLQVKEPPTPEQVQAAVAELDAAFKEGVAAKTVGAIQNSVGVVDPAVIKVIADHGLRSKDAAVKQAAVESLGHMRHADALDALLGFYKKERKALEKDMILQPAVFKAIGRHGDPAAVDVLSDKLFSSVDHAAIQARIYGLGNIRTTESLEALLAMTNKAGQRGVDNYMEDIQIALVHLTGVDQGRDIRMWQSWWQKSKKGFEIPEPAPPMDRIMQFKWNEYWGLPQKEAQEAGSSGSGS